MTIMRRLSRSLLILFALLASAAPVRAAENVKYFWTVEVDHSHTYKCYHPVDPKLIGKAHCSRVSYDKEGRIVLIERLSAGHLVYNGGFAQIKIEYLDGFERRSYLNIFGRSMTITADYNSERFKIDKESHRSSLFLYDQYGQPTSDGSGVSRYQWELDEKGFVTKEITLNLGGERITDNHGVYESRYKPDDKGRMIEERHFGKEGQLIVDGNGVAVKKFKWDGDHHIIEARFLGPDELPLGRRNVARSVYVWDDRDYETQINYYDDQDKLLRILKYSYDAYGNQMEVLQFDDVDKPRADGIAKTTYTYDNANHLLDVVIFDKDGKRMDDEDLTSEAVYKYDEKGNEIERSYKKADGSLGVDKSAGFAIERSLHESRGHDIEDRFFDEAGKPIMLKGGYSIERRKFNENSDEIEASYYDKEDRPVNISDGTQRTTWSYDASGKTLEVHNYDAAGKEVNLDSLNEDNASVSDASASVIGTTSVLKSTEGSYSFKFNNTLWEQSKEQNAAKPDFSISHRSGSAFALIFHHESDEAPADVLKSLMTDYEGSMTEVSLLRKEYKTVNSHDALFAQIQANIKDVPFIIVQYIFKTKNGHVIILCGAPKSSFDKLESEMMGLLNGMTITE